MDALCDPRAFLSAQEKRAEQLKALGIEENDISGDVIQSKGDGGKGDAKGKDGKKEEKKGKEFISREGEGMLKMGRKEERGKEGGREGMIKGKDGKRKK